MVRRSVYRSVLALSAALLMGGPLSAQSVSSPYRFIEESMEIAPLAGYIGAAEGRFGFGMQDAPAVGARFGIEISGPLALDVVGWYSPSSRNVVDPAGTGGPSVLGEADLQLAGLEARPRLSLTGRRTWNRLQPYVLGGIGVMTDFAGGQVADLGVPVESRFDFGTAFTASAGAGIRFVPSGRLVGRLEFAGLYHEIDTPGGFSAPGLDLGTVPESEWVVAPTLTLSLGIRF